MASRGRGHNCDVTTDVDAFISLIDCCIKISENGFFFHNCPFLAGLDHIYYKHYMLVLRRKPIIMRTCPVLDAEENVVFVFVADSGQVGDGSWQITAFLTAQHSTELDLALQRHVINFTHIRQTSPLYRRQHADAVNLTVAILQPYD